MSVFRIDRNFKVILNPDAAKLVPELRLLSEDELLFVILSADYVDSPYRMKPEAERILLSWRRIFGGEELKLSEKLKTALELYKSLVFDIKRETIDILKKKLVIEHRKMLKDEVNTISLKEITANISFLESRIDLSEKAVSLNEKMYELKGKKKLSMIEQWQLNQKEYRKFNEG